MQHVSQCNANYYYNAHKQPAPTGALLALRTRRWHKILMLKKKTDIVAMPEIMLRR